MFPVPEEAQLFMNISYICWRLVIFIKDFITGIEKIYYYYSIELLLFLVTIICSIYGGSDLRFMFQSALTVFGLHILLSSLEGLFTQDSKTKIRFFLCLVLLMTLFYIIAAGWLTIVINVISKITKITLSNSKRKMIEDIQNEITDTEKDSSFAFGIIPKENGHNIIEKESKFAPETVIGQPFMNLFEYTQCIFCSALFLALTFGVSYERSLIMKPSSIILTSAKRDYVTMKLALAIYICRYFFLIIIFPSLYCITFIMIFDPKAYMTSSKYIRHSQKVQHSYNIRFSKDLINVCQTCGLFQQYSQRHLHSEYRYLNEDARFECQSSNRFTDETVVVWKSNDKCIRNSNKFHIKTSFVNVTRGNKSAIENGTTRVRSTLNVYRIRKEDFGVYQCFIMSRTNRNSISDRSKHSKRGEMHSFALNRIKEKNQFFNTYPGGITSIETVFYNFINRKDMKNFQNDHFVNKRHWSQQTKTLYVSGCSPLTQLFVFIDLIKPHIGDEFRIENENFSWKYSKQICMHPRHIGLHEMQIRNSSLNSRQIPNGEKDTFQSFAYYLFGPNTSESQINHLNLKNTTNLALSELQDMWMNFQNSWLIRFTREILILIFMSFVVICGIWEIFKMIYFKIKFRYYRHLGLARNGGLINHIMVLNSEEDNDIVDKSIVQPLEMLGKKVCFPGRDFAEQGNMPEMTLYQKASEKCSTFILVLTKSLMESRREWRMLFEYVLAARKKELEIEDSDVIVIDINCDRYCYNKITQLERTFPNSKFIDFKTKPEYEQRNMLINALKDK